jgi:ankyrin repeat protein
MSRLTPLHFLGVFMHDPRLAELLIQKGADINATDHAGHTPLERAVRAGNAQVAEVLRRHGGH